MNRPQITVRWPKVPRPTGAVWVNVAFTVPVVLFNVVAFFGQYQWANDHLAVTAWMPWLFSAALESAGVYLAWEAHVALRAGDAALRIRLASYAVAGLVGFLNYTHWEATSGSAAVAFGLMSAASPWLWSIRSRSLHRAELRSAGLIDERTVRFSLARWVMYPRWTFQVWRSALWAGVTSPETAVARFQPSTKAQKDATKTHDDAKKSPTDATNPKSIPEEIQSAPDIPTSVPGPAPAPARRPTVSRDQLVALVAEHLRVDPDAKVNAIAKALDVKWDRVNSVMDAARSAAKEPVGQATVIPLAGGVR